MTKLCKACLAEHNEETHAATNRVHEWFRAKVTKHLHAVAEEPPIAYMTNPAPHQGELDAA